MVGMASIAGGAKHGLATLSHAERDAAQRALARLKSSGGGLGSKLEGSTRSATVYGGSAIKGAGLTASLIHGQGSDTFMGGARSALTHTVAGSDTVLSGSAAFGGHTSVSDALARHGGANFSLSADTINVAGATAEGVKAAHPPDATTHAHTITLADKTTVTITGVSAHDITKLTH
jgi:hypothetical protein